MNDHLEADEPFAHDDDARWISPAEDAIAEDRPAYVLARRFTLTELPGRAWLHATALGLYEAYINGRRVGDLELTPGSSSYDETLYAQAYDVTRALVVGTNDLELVLSDGWFRGRNGGMQHQDVWGTTTAARAKLEIETTSGTCVAVATGAEWTSRTSRILRADLMTGQTTDFSVPESGRHPVVLREVHAPVPTWSPSPPVRRIEERAPLSTTLISPGTTVVDFGQNFAGWVRLSDLGAAGDVTELEYAEHLAPSGDITTDHLDIRTPEGVHLPYRQVDRVVAGPGGDEFEPRHTVHGFRYVRITHPGRDLDPAGLTGVVVHSDLRRTGSFECSDPLVNQFHEAAVWSFRSNVVDVPTDCPTRERSAWTGDFQVFAPTATLLYDVHAFARKWLQSVRDDQFDDGSLAMFSPDSERLKHSDNPARIAGGSAGWGDAAVLVPWQLYESYGDRRVLEESWDSMRAWVDFALRAARSGRHPRRAARTSEPLPHEEFLWDTGFHFGEWLEPGAATPEDPAAAYLTFLAEDKSEVATAYLYRSASSLARIAGILGEDAAATTYGDAAERVREAWRTEFLQPDGRTLLDSQAGYVRALAFDLVPDELAGVTASRLVQLVEDAGDRLTTGFLSTGLLLPVLADHGHAETAFRLLLRRGTPSWLGMLDRGATTVWEDWNGVDEHGVATASLNHYSKGAVVRFLYSHVVGLTQHDGSVGWERFEVRPTVGGGLTRAAARLDTPRGTIDARWRASDRTFHLDLTVPETATALVVLPDGSSHDVAAGTHHLTCHHSPDLPGPTATGAPS